MIQEFCALTRSKAHYRSDLHLQIKAHRVCFHLSQVHKSLTRDLDVCYCDSIPELAFDLEVNVHFYINFVDVQKLALANLVTNTKVSHLRRNLHRVVLPNVKV